MNVAKIDLDELKKMTKALNEATYEKDGKDVLFMEKKLKAIAVTKENLAKNFDAAIQGISEDVVNELPEEIIDFYNKFFGEEAEEEAEETEEEEAEEKEEEETEEEETKEEEQKPPEKEKKATEKKPVEKEKKAVEKEKKPPKEKTKVAIPLSCFGHQVGSQAAKLDDLLAPGKPISLDDLSKKSGRSPLGVKSHMKHLRDARGLEITEKDGVYQLVIKKK